MRLIRRLPTPTPVAVLAAAMAATAVFIFWAGRGQTFFADEWVYLSRYLGTDPEVLLKPNVTHLVIAPLLIYKVLFNTVGIADYAPYRILSIALNLLCAGLFFQLVRDRLGDWVALAPTVVLLGFGASWDTVGISIGTAYLLMMATGLGMLLALQRRDLLGDLVACVLLLVSIASVSLGLAFVAAAATEILFARGRSAWRRWWVFAIPLVLWIAWAIWASQYAADTPQPSKIPSLPTSLFDSLSSNVAALLGLYRDAGQTGVTYPFVNPDLGRPIAAGLIALLVLRLRSTRPLTRWTAVLAVALLAYWALASISADPRKPELTRYMYPGSVLLLLLVAELGRGFSLSPRGRLALAAVVPIALLPNLADIHYGNRFLREGSELNRTELAVVELERGRLDPKFVLEAPGLVAQGEIADLLMNAEMYFTFRDLFGSPADTVAELKTRSERARQAADRVLVRALGIAPAPVARLGAGPAAPVPEAVESGTVSRRDGCVVVRPAAATVRLTIRLPPGGMGYRAAPGASLVVKLRRFGDYFANDAIPAPAGSTQALAIPRDDAPDPWHAQITATKTLEVCPLPARAAR